jgi:pyoverdine/dityrosine biosynthesis protein Dit1
MKDINLTAEMCRVVQRCVWFEPPEEAIKDIPRLVAYILTHGMPEDTQVLRKQLSDDDLKQVLDKAPAGIYDARSWAYWNLVIGRYDTPPLSVRSFD